MGKSVHIEIDQYVSLQMHVFEDMNLSSFA